MVITYFEALALINNSRNGKVNLAHKTYLRLDFDNPDNYATIYYWSTPVVSICSNHTYTLNSGGRMTSTTKKRINDYSPASLYQDNFQWLLKTPEGIYPFFDNIIIDSFGSIIPSL